MVYRSKTKKVILLKQMIWYSSCNEFREGWRRAFDLIQEIKTNNKLKKDLRESDLVTVSIGANDFLHKLAKNGLSIGEVLELKDIVKEVIPDIDTCLKEIRKYAKEDMIVVGYYNPIPFLFNTSSNDLDKLFAYIDEEYNNLCKEYNCAYISMYQLFKNHKDYLPNPSDIHPSLNGYQEMANKIIKDFKMWNKNE